ETGADDSIDLPPVCGGTGAAADAGHDVPYRRHEGIEILGRRLEVIGEQTSCGRDRFGECLVRLGQRPFQELQRFLGDRIHKDPPGWGAVKKPGRRPGLATAAERSGACFMAAWDLG